MADYSTAAASAETALETLAAAGMVEEYQIGDRRVKRTSAVTQIDALCRLNGLANRSLRGGVCTLGKLQEGAS